MTGDRSGKKVWLGRVLALAALVVAGPPAATAQSARTSASMSITVTVVRSCTVDVASTPTSLAESPSTAQLAASSEPACTLKCGKDAVAYPLKAGSSSTPVASNNYAAVTRSPDGRAVVIQFQP
jgi:hypothetical protein